MYMKMVHAFCVCVGRLSLTCTVCVSYSPWNATVCIKTFDCKTYLSEQPSESLSTPIMFGVHPDNANDVQYFR